MENINLLTSEWSDHAQDHKYLKSEIFSVLVITNLTEVQSNLLLEIVIAGTNTSSCICCGQEQAKYIIKKVSHGEMKLSPSAFMIQKLIQHSSKKNQFGCEEFQNFIKKLNN